MNAIGRACGRGHIECREPAFNDPLFNFNTAAAEKFCNLVNC